MDITDEEIFNLEIYHDNKDNFELIKLCKFFYDTIKNKKIIPNENYKNEIITKNNCENIIKSLIYEDIIKYNNNEIIQDNTKQPKIHFDNIIYIFDNSALTEGGLNAINNAFNSNNKKIKIYVPFIYLCERKIIEKSTFDELIDNINNFKTNYNIDIYFDNYRNENNDLLEKYKIECQHIGAYLSNDDFFIINYNIFLALKEMTSDKKQLLLNNQFAYLLKYLNNTPKNNFYNWFLKDFHELFSQNYDKIIANSQKFFKTKKGDKLYIDLCRIVISFKEARDSYYIKEILDFIKLNKNFNPIYITTDQISNVRCVLNKNWFYQLV